LKQIIDFKARPKVPSKNKNKIELGLKVPFEIKKQKIL
jgi:hypothetical protein